MRRLWVLPPYTMWSVLSVCLLLTIGTVFGENDFQETDNSTAAAPDYSRGELREMLSEMNAGEFGSFLDDMADWATSAKEYIEEKTEMLSHPFENGRRLKYKKMELKFITKTLLIFKIVLGLILPIGIIASKILSWKAVTLSLMAFMLAKILFVKNLLAGKNALSVTPANIVPPYYIHPGSNDPFWKRHEVPNAFT